MSQKYLYYPGCSMESSAKAYNDSLMAIKDSLGLALEEIHDWNCCGATEYVGISTTPAYALISRNLALAYKNTNAENPFQKEQFFNNALENLKKAELFDSTNVKVNEAIAELKTENFQKYLDRGVSAFRKGTRDALQYINADIYLTNALRLDPESETARSYLKKAREKSLNVLDPGQDVPFAVTDQMENGEYLAFLIVLHNQLSNSISVNAGNFYLVNENGKQVQGKNSGMFSTPLEPSSVANGDEIAGVVAFPLPVDKNGARLEFRKDGDLLGYKNLP